jgi:hypothetical protein
MDCFVVARHPLQSSARANFPKPTSSRLLAWNNLQFAHQTGRIVILPISRLHRTNPAGQADRFWFADGATNPCMGGLLR